MIRTLLPALTLLALPGCKRDPQFFGYWEITSMERNGIAQGDAGFFEIDDRSEVALFLRYRWTGSEFQPDPRPVVQFGTSNAKEQDDVFDAYKQKGETYELTLSFWGSLDVVEYTGTTAQLHGKDTTWPAAPETELGDTRLFLKR